MTTEDYDTLRKIAAVQAKRRKNWRGRMEPRNAEMEAKHMEEIEQLRRKLP